MKTSYRTSDPLLRLIRFAISNAAVLAILVLAGESKAQTPISSGETRTNQSLAVAQNTVFSFPGSVGDLVTIQMTRVSGNFNPTFDLLSPTGDLLKTVTDAATASPRLAPFALLASGTYRIICRDDTGSFGGGYNLTLINCLGQNLSDNDRGEIISGETKVATMDPSDMDAFSFSGVAGDLVNIQMTRVSGDFNPTFDLLSPTGSVLKTVTDAATASPRLALFALPACGSYPIICRDNTGSYGGGYNLSFTLVPLGNPCDSDNDGLPDSWELKYFGDLRYGADDDPDGDRLKNKDEFTKNTDPSKADTDGDGFNDGTEVALGSDPLDANSKPSTELRILVKTVDIEFLVLAGQRYQLQASHDFKNWVNLGDSIQGDNSLFRTNIDVRGTDYTFFRAPATAGP